MSLVGVVEDMRSHIKCSICPETLSTPILLICGHRFCKECLLKVCPDTSITCPACGAQTSGNAQNLPHDTQIQNVINGIKRIESMIEKSKNCALCVGTPADVRCLDCQAYLCETCHVDHSNKHYGKNHIVVKDDPFLICTKHGKDLAYVCGDCHELVCFCCLLDGCKRHKYATAGEALGKYFVIREKCEGDAEFISANYTTLKEKLHSNFEAVSTSIQKFSDDMISSIKKESETMIKYLKKMESNALDILEPSKTAADGLKEYSDTELEECRHEVPVGLLENLPSILRPEVHLSTDSYVLEDIRFEPNTNTSIGSVRIALSRSESNTSDCRFPRLYGSQRVGIKSGETHSDVGQFSFILDPAAKESTIASLFTDPDDVLWTLRDLFEQKTE